MAEPTYDSIILAGQRFKLRGGVKVVTFEDSAQWSFDKASMGMPASAMFITTPPPKQ